MLLAYTTELWIRIQIESVFRTFVDLDPLSEYRTGQYGIDKRQKV